MKTKYLLLTVILPILFSCEKASESSMNMGDQPDEAALDAVPSITLHGAKSADGVVNVVVTRGEGYASERIYATSTRPTILSQTIVLEVDTTLAAAYRTKTGVNYKILPKPFYTFDGQGILDMNQDASESSSSLLKIYATNAVGNQLEAGEYLLPVVAKSSSQKVSTTLYYSVLVREPFKGDAELYEGEDGLFVFYVNTQQYDPRIVTDYYMNKYDVFSSMQIVWDEQIGNLINLRTVRIDYDESTGRPILSLGSDMRHILNDYNKYLRPLKETKHTICLCIEGSNKGIGFCNMTDRQIEDFSEQVRQVIDMYDLDGVNLWDRNSGYGKEGMPVMNTTSYPKLIKALRESLGTEKLLTVTDYEEPTEYFWNTEATGGIAVGDYIDYAWSGYNNNKEGYQVVDPYHQGESCVSSLHPRKPFAGLDFSKYGCINEPMMNSKTTNIDIINETTSNLIEWGKTLKRNNIYVSDDLRTNLQDNLEGVYAGGLPLFLNGDSLMNGGRYIYQVDSQRLSDFGGYSGFNKWLKDW